METQEVGVAYHLAFAEGRDGWCLSYITPCSEGEAGTAASDVLLPPA